MQGIIEEWKEYVPHIYQEPHKRNDVAWGLCNSLQLFDFDQAQYEVYGYDGVDRNNCDENACNFCLVGILMIYVPLLRVGSLQFFNDAIVGIEILGASSHG